MKFPKKRVLAIALGIAVFGVGGTFAYQHLGHGEHRVPAKFENSLAINGTELVVRAHRVGADSASDSESSFTGTLQPRYQPPIGFRVAGKIASRHVEVGARVKKGELLFSLDPLDYDLNLRVAEADHASAQSMVTQASADEERLRQLRLSNSVSASDYDAALANRDVAQARLESAKKRLELAHNQRQYCELRADSDGLITAIYGEAGQVVNVGQTVLQLMQGNELEAVISIPEHRVADVRSCHPQISFWSHPNRRFSAELRELSPIADPVSRTYDARFRLLDGTDDVAIGMTATVYLSNQKDQGIPIPTSSIANRLEKSVVWKIDEKEGTISSVPIEVVQVKKDTAIVRAPLQPGDLIVSAGVQRVDEDVRVRVWSDPKDNGR